MKDREVSRHCLIRSAIRASITYTPVEVVDFITNSIDHLLKYLRPAEQVLLKVTPRDPQRFLVIFLVKLDGPVRNALECPSMNAIHRQQRIFL